MRYLRLTAPLLAAAALAACAPATPPTDTEGTPTSTPTSTPAIVDPIGNLGFTITPETGWNGDNTCSGDAAASNCGLVLAKNRFTLEIIQSPARTSDDGYLLTPSAGATSTESEVWVRTMERGYKRTDRYIGRPDGQFVWAGSVFSGVSGRVLYPAGGTQPTFSIRAIYNRTATGEDPLSGLPIRGSSDLDTTLVEINRMVESMQLK